MQKARSNAITYETISTQQLRDGKRSLSVAAGAQTQGPSPAVWMEGEDVGNILRSSPSTDGKEKGSVT